MLPVTPSVTRQPREASSVATPSPSQSERKSATTTLPAGTDEASRMASHAWTIRGEPLTSIGGVYGVAPVATMTASARAARTYAASARTPVTMLTPARRASPSRFVIAPPISWRSGSSCASRTCPPTRRSASTSVTR